MDDVYSGVNPHPSVGLMTRFFCGQAPECHAADPAPAAVRRAALERALHNLHHRYVWVGVLEQFKDSLELLTRQLPDYFGALGVAQASREHVRPANSTRYLMPSNRTLRKVAVEVESDMELYNFAIRLLQCRLQKCAQMG